MLDFIDRELIFNHYAYFSSTSPKLVEHFEKFSKDLFFKFPQQANQLIIDVGSNDGIMLKPLKKLGARVLGIDPAKNIARIANKHGIKTIGDFFGSTLVPKLIKASGKAGIISSSNTLAHTDTIHDIIYATAQLLDSRGVFVFEVQYLADLLKKNEFDNIYHEHICYFSLHPIIYLLKLYNLRVFDVEHIDTHGGSLRVYASHVDSPFTTNKKVQTKQNLYMPGTHIPIVSPKKIKEDIPDYILILAWNYAEAIIQKEQWFVRQGGKFILPIPFPKIID